MLKARGRIGPWGRRRCSPVPLYAAPCNVESVTPRYFLPFRDTSNLRVGGCGPASLGCLRQLRWLANPSRRAIDFESIKAREAMTPRAWSVTMGSARPTRIAARSAQPALQLRGTAGQRPSTAASGFTSASGSRRSGSPLRGPRRDLPYDPTCPLQSVVNLRAFVASRFPRFARSARRRREHRSPLRWRRATEPAQWPA